MNLLVRNCTRYFTLSTIIPRANRRSKINVIMLYCARSQPITTVVMVPYFPLVTFTKFGTRNFVLINEEVCVGLMYKKTPLFAH